MAGKPKTPKNDTLDQLKRVQADFENYVKRVEKERASMQQEIRHNVIHDLLHIIDDFHHAVHNVNNASQEELAQGVVTIAKRLDKFLESQGVKCIPCKGSPDPFKHEVVLEVDSKQSPGSIVQEIQPGYIIGDKVLRYAKVSISRRKQ
ncbi:MAG: nucleotide exchange factor GrpE [Candidatus Woesearchaeota archaeon]|jgi:molecular chaperone GrpE|nr:nucleotide exchange factor GrpE [Candidatus Woesearchaeota archaeon]MDP7181471.1 nucleotide exchange factor GrpE [Candidatus Woesearchaeota archaeon]MDP7198513.1 nucleotide exchange factor GrpE [Candidatus Woesearchaeota archaeon]MDP7466745.1 nucleotide exchange factor GrpE [Candidatus Woesearchaeota archaeon]MDP7647970.1 nucleotide exchange factor GrpE [Candidatus Woesearchaeota archaeon]|tara:strand:+ start:487 stop:930 length:444 start_codon:yes stop_codon:yes gene_type:complete